MTLREIEFTTQGSLFWWPNKSPSNDIFCF
jgi:hypothetical protein